MELRRNPSRKCKDEGLLIAALMTKADPVTTAPKQTKEFERDGDYQQTQRTKRSQGKTKTPKQIKNGPKSPRITREAPFPFFELPREVRDLVYSHLVVHQASHQQHIIDATSILNNRKKRATAQAARDRVNRQRVSSGRRPICARATVTEPLIEVTLLRVSQRIYQEASDYIYGTNTFAILLNKLPSITMEIPSGWDLSRIKRLQIEIQLKDALRMNSYMNWTAFFSDFSSLRFLRILPTFHPRYYDWAQTELSDWKTTHYIHKAFFRELLAAIPSDVDVHIGPGSDAKSDVVSQGRRFVNKTFLGDMYRELSSQKDSVSTRLAAVRVVD